MEDSVLYVLAGTSVHRLNLSELWSGIGTSPPTRRPDFQELELSPLPSTRYPNFDLMIVDSKVYLIGSYRGDQRDGPDWVPCIRRGQDSDLEVERSIRDTTVTKVNPVAMSMEGKFYVLTTKVGRLFSGDFEVFDPVSRLWKVLPNPPFKDSDCILSQHFTLGHNLVIQNSNTGANYWFNTRKERWKPAPPPHGMPTAPFFGTAHFKDFLIGIPLDCLHVLTYKLNSYGVPIRCGELVELRNLLLSPVKNPFAYITLVNDGGLILLMCAGFDKDKDHTDYVRPSELRIRVSLFQLFTISNDTRLHAHIKATETYSIPFPWNSNSNISACLWGDGLKNLDNEKLTMLEKWKFLRDDKLARMEERLRELDADRILQVLNRMKILSDDKLMRKVEELEKLDNEKILRMVERLNKLYSFTGSLICRSGRDDKLVRMEERLREFDADRILEVLNRLKKLNDDKLVRKVEELEKLDDNKILRMVKKLNKLDYWSFHKSLMGMHDREVEKTK